MKKEVCIVTPEIIGPHKNGGIGTQAYYLAQLLADNNYKTTVLFTGICQNNDDIYWSEYYKKLNIRYVQVDKRAKDYLGQSYEDWFVNRSFLVYEYLRNNNFDYIHFQEWQANGFHTIQGKKNNNEFEDTMITVTMHSSTQWINQAMNWVNNRPNYEKRLEWCERYCCENCDLLISPSSYMFKWALDNDWKLCENRRVIPNCFENIIKINIDKNVDINHLIFFGRLEARKGLEMFCNAVLQVINKYPDLIKKVSFVGKSGYIRNTDGKQYINSRLAGKGINYQIFTNFDSFEAMEYLERENGVVVIPSLMENYPYTVVECIENKLFFIASNVGGIPELADERVLFEPQLDSLVKKVLSIHKISNMKLKHKYSKTKARDGWLSIHN